MQQESSDEETSGSVSAGKSDEYTLEERLKESEAALSAIFDAAQEGILVADAASGHLIMANPAMCRMTGYGAAELSAMHVMDLHAPEEHVRLQQIFQDMENGKFSPIHELPFLRKDGSVFYADTSSTPFTVKGKSRFLGIFRDVTDRRQIKQALARREEAFARTEAIARIGSWDWDLVTDTLIWSDENYRVLGYPPGSLAPNVEAFMKSVHPEDRQRVDTALKASLVDASVPLNIEHRVLRSNGEIRLVHQVGKVYRDETGKPVRMIGTAQDVTDQKRIESELMRYRDDLQVLVRERTAELEKASRRNATIVDAAMDGFFTAGLDGQVTDCNDIYCQMLGYTRDELCRLNIRNLEADETPEEMAARIGRILETGHDRFDTRHRRKDGSLIHVEAKVSLAQIGAERIFFSFVHDITDRKEGEAALILARNEAERANQAKSLFLSRMSHELRTPLNAILGFGQLLECDPQYPLPAPQQENVGLILQAGRHLLELINEILDLSRIEAGKFSLSLEAVELLPVFQECRRLVMPAAEARGIRIASTSAGGCNAVLADRTRLRQVFLNLLSNAVKYNHPEGSVTVSCARRGDALRIGITDTGPGLSQEQQALLFKPFERLDADKQAIEGTGIGLALSKRLVELMHGEIGLESSPGVGSTFWVELPVAELPADRHTQSLPVAPAAAVAASRLWSILYIEDNAANMRLMERILRKREGVCLITAERPDRGLELAAAQRPDLILLDINLPEMDGYQVLTRLRAMPETRAIPVVGISANAMTKDLERARAALFDGYLTKPLDIPALLETVDKFLAPLAAGERPDSDQG